MSLSTHDSVSSRTHSAGAAPFEVVPLTKYIGAEIRGLDLRAKAER